MEADAEQKMEETCSATKTRTELSHDFVLLCRNSSAKWNGGSAMNTAYVAEDEMVTNREDN